MNLDIASYFDFYLKNDLQTVPDLWWFELKFFNFMLVRKW